MEKKIAGFIRAATRPSNDATNRTKSTIFKHFSFRFRFRSFKPHSTCGAKWTELKSELNWCVCLASLNTRGCSWLFFIIDLEVLIVYRELDSITFYIFTKLHCTAYGSKQYWLRCSFSCYGISAYLFIMGSTIFSTLKPEGFWPSF